MSYEVKSFSFEGIPSGDGESFVFKVTPEVYKNIIGKEPPDYVFPYGYDSTIDDIVVEDKSFCYLYPDDLFKDEGKLRVCIKYEKI
jgi:hypothetical protein